MKVRTTNRRRVASACAAAFMGALVLSGCAAGQVAETAQEHSVVDGSTADIGQISLRNVALAAPAGVSGYAPGDSAKLVAAIVNNGLTADELVSVTSETATSVALSPSVIASSAVSTPAPTESSTASVSTPIPLPANQLVTVGGDTGAVVDLKDLKAGLIPGQSLRVTFTFRDAGSVTVAIPVRVLSDSTGGETVDIEPSGE